MRSRNALRLDAEGLEAALTRIAQAAPGPCLIVDPATDLIRAANTPASALFDAPSLAGTRFSRLHPDCLPALIVFADEVAEYGWGWTRALKGRDARGGALVLEYEGRALTGPEGPLLALYAADLVARARRDADAAAEAYARDGLLAWTAAERMFRETERVNELILSAAGDGIYGVDPQGMVTFVNPAAERMLGWGRRT